jgi:hypothetical protein
MCQKICILKQGLFFFIYISYARQQRLFILNYVSVGAQFNPSAWRHLIPGQYCAVGGFSTWVFKFEPESAKHFKYV